MYRIRSKESETDMVSSTCFLIMSLYLLNVKRDTVLIYGAEIIAFCVLLAHNVKQKGI